MNKFECMFDYDCYEKCPVESCEECQYHSCRYCICVSAKQCKDCDMKKKKIDSTPIILLGKDEPPF